MSSSDRVRRGAVAPVIASVAAVALAVVAVATALAASPSPSSAVGGDPRSAGEGPGLVGDPLFAIGIVVLIGVVALGATLLYVRATGGSRGA